MPYLSTVLEYVYVYVLQYTCAQCTGTRVRTVVRINATDTRVPVHPRALEYRYGGAQRRGKGYQ